MADGLQAVPSVIHGQSALRLAGKNCRFFPSKREFSRFSPRNRRLAAKTVKQIKSLPANSRSDANREYVPAEPGIKLAEPGNYREDCASLGIVHDGRAPKENQKETHLCTRRNAININLSVGAILPRKLDFCVDQPRDFGEPSSRDRCRFRARSETAAREIRQGVRNIAEGFRQSRRGKSRTPKTMRSCCERVIRV